MLKKIAYLIFVVMFLEVSIFGENAFAQDIEPPYPVRVAVFYLDTCPHCHDELAFIDKLVKKYPTLELYKFEVSSGFQNRSLFSKVVEHYGLNGGVPVTIIGEDVLVGFDNEKGELGKRLVENIEYCQENVCSSWIEEVIGSNTITNPNNLNEIQKEKGNDNQKQEQEIALERSSATIFGKKLSFNQETPILFLGMILGLADGINPCMFSVLIFLLTYLLAIGSRKKAVKAGLAFVATTFVVYFSLMLGLIKVIDILQIENFARWFIIVVAFFAGVVMIKDYFFYGKWFSLEIPERFRPKIQMLIKKGTVPSTIILAIFSSIVELPCTSVLPLAYVNVLSKRGISPFWHLIWYNLFFVVPLLIIIFGVAFAWTKVESLENFRLKFRKHMRLGAGILLILLSIAFWLGWI